jgi:hypothetical protein
MAVSVKTNLTFWPHHLPDSISKGQQKRALFQGEDRFLVGRRGAKKRANFDQGGVSTWETPKQTKTRPLVPSSVDKPKLANGLNVCSVWACVQETKPNNFKVEQGVNARPPTEHRPSCQQTLAKGSPLPPPLQREAREAHP